MKQRILNNVSIMWSALMILLSGLLWRTQDLDIIMAVMEGEVSSTEGSGEEPAGVMYLSNISARSLPRL